MRLVALTLLAASWLPGADTGSALVVQSPLDYQVFQRATKDSGTILVRGRVASADDGADYTIEARIDAGPWTSMHFDRGTREFQGELNSKSGGFFPVGLRLSRSSAVIAESTVPHVGVGELFVIAGQSNATNYGEVRQVSASRMVVSFGGEGWQIADDPQPGVQDKSTKGSFIPAFGDAMYEEYRVPIGVACAGYGATSVRQWLPKRSVFAAQPTMTKFVVPSASGGWESTGQLFDTLVDRMRQFGPHGFRAVLWHQGESDAHQQPGHQISGDDYYDLLVKVIQTSRREVGWNVPWLVAEATYHTPDDPSSPEIRAAQERIWRNGIAIAGPDTDQLTSQFREKAGAGVHFSATGLPAHGKLWARAVIAWLNAGIL